MPWSLPTRFGYDHFFGLRSGAADYFSHRVDLIHSDPLDGLYRDEKRVDVPGYLTDILADEAVRYVSTKDPQPFFLSLHFNAPHWPWEGPEDEEVSRDLKDIFHRSGGTLETYAKMVAAMDRAIGRVLDAIKTAGEEENTIVVFTSDNGGERYSDTWPFTGVKGELLEGGIRVPLLMKWPHRITPGLTSDRVMASMDFLPTLLAATRHDAASQGYNGDGLNLLPILTGQAEPVARTLFWRFKASQQAAVRDGDWKYLKLGGKEHLFNVRTDPRERARLNDLYPDRMSELRKKYDAWNAQMLPYTLESYSESTKASYADRY
ncbi:Sulfatase [Sphingobium faniae]|nr:Sulfatase [Sphingobium faniae]